MTQFLDGIISVILPFVTDVSMWGPFVGQNEMPFGRGTHLAPSNIVLDRCPNLPTGRGDLGSRNPQLP